MTNTDRPEGELGRIEPEFSCPRCGERNPVPIIYGKPSVLLELSRPIKLGGCVVRDDSPTHHCRRCGRDWAEPTGPRVEGSAFMTFGRDA